MIRTAILCLAMVLSLATESAAQKDLARERVSLTFNKVPAADVFPPLAKSLGYELGGLDPKLRETAVTIQLENVTARTALTAICESIGCRWEQTRKYLYIWALTTAMVSARPNEKGRALLDQMRAAGRYSGWSRVASLDEQLPDDIEWWAMDLGEVLKHLANSFKASVDVLPSIAGRKVSMTINSATLRQALDAVCAAAQCRWELVEGPPSHRPPAPPEPSRVIRVRDAADRPAPPGRPR